jgi:SAM-dependent methyltransferase
MTPARRADIFGYLQRFVSRTPGPRSCPVCESAVEKFFPLGKEYFEEAARTGFTHPFDKSEMMNWAEYSCPVCWASDRDRLMAIYLKQRFQQVPRGNSIDLVEFAPTPPLAKILRGNPRVRYRSADLSKQDVDDRVDLMDLSSYPDGTFDAWVCSHVLEHVPDDRRAMSELRRILKPGGWGLLVVPISLLLGEVLEDPSVQTDDERWKYFGQHDHVRFYNREGFVSRLEGAGFQVQRLGIEYFGKGTFQRHALTATSAVYIAGRPELGRRA